MTYFTYLFILIIVYIIYYGITIALDKSSNKSKANQGEIAFAGIHEHDTTAVHSDTLMDEFRKSNVFTQPAPTAKDFEYDAEQDGVDMLDDEDITRQ